MSTLSTPAAIWPFTLFGEARSVRSEADAMIALCGVGALEAAELNAHHEDFGLLPTTRAGHWARVAREIARRGDAGPVTRQAA